MRVAVFLRSPESMTKLAEVNADVQIKMLSTQFVSSSADEYWTDDPMIFVRFKHLDRSKFVLIGERTEDTPDVRVVPALTEEMLKAVSKLPKEDMPSEEEIAQGLEAVLPKCATAIEADLNDEELISSAELVQDITVDAAIEAMETAELLEEEDSHEESANLVTQTLLEDTQPVREVQVSTDDAELEAQQAPCGLDVQTEVEVSPEVVKGEKYEVTSLLGGDTEIEATPVLDKLEEADGLIPEKAETLPPELQEDARSEPVLEQLTAVPTALDSSVDSESSYVLAALETPVADCRAESMQEPTIPQWRREPEIPIEDIDLEALDLEASSESIPEDRNDFTTVVTTHTPMSIPRIATEASLVDTVQTAPRRKKLPTARSMRAEVDKMREQNRSVAVPPEFIPVVPKALLEGRPVSKAAKMIVNRSRRHSGRCYIFGNACSMGGAPELAYNFACECSRVGTSKVVLIDLDLRGFTLSKSIYSELGLSFEDSSGIENVLRITAAEYLENLTVFTTVVSNESGDSFHFIRGNQTYPFQLKKLLLQINFRSLIENLKQVFDYVVVDLGDFRELQKYQTDLLRSGYLVVVAFGCQTKRTVVDSQLVCERLPCNCELVLTNYRIAVNPIDVARETHRRVCGTLASGRTRGLPVFSETPQSGIADDWGRILDALNSM